MRRDVVVLPLTLILGLAIAGCATSPDGAPGVEVRRGEPVAVRIVAINDFHGHLEPPPGSWTPVGREPEGPAAGVRAGGAAHLATVIAALREGRAHSIVVSAGDNIGASPLPSALFHDEPAVMALGKMGVALSAPGNHEFDRGRAELERIAKGGCHPKHGCSDGLRWAGAPFQYLAANVTVRETGETLFPPYAVREFDGVKVGFIGAVLRGTPGIVDAAGVRGLAFGDEAAAVNAVVPELRRQGVEAIVVLLHEGGFLRTDARADDDCEGFHGPAPRIVSRLDPAVDVVVSGHTHRAYRCRINGRLITSAASHGRLATAIDLTIDRASRDVVRAEATNVVVDRAQHAAEPGTARFVADVVERSKVPAQRAAGRLGAPLSATRNAAGESSLGTLVAESHLAAFRENGRADIAFTNPGGLRAPIRPRDAAGTVTYGDLFAAQPFSNVLVAVTLSGAEILSILERQFHKIPERSRILQVAGLDYAWEGRQPLGSRVVPGTVRVGGQRLDPKAEYRVVVNSFLHGGGDGFGPFAKGRDPMVGPGDLAALERFLSAEPPRQPFPPGRIRRLDVP